MKYHNVSPSTRPSVATLRSRLPACRGFHSSTSQLNVSTVCGVHWTASSTKTAQGELTSGRVCSFSSDLNVSSLCGVRWMVAVTRTAQVQLEKWTSVLVHFSAQR